MSAASSSHLLVFTRGVHRGLLTLLREHGWLTTLFALTGILMLAQLLVIISIGAQGLDSLIRSRMDLRLQILDAAPDERIHQFYSAINAMPVVDEVMEITPQKAYEMERQNDPELITFLEKFKLDNPFPRTFSVTLKSLDDYDTFASFVQGSEWNDVVDPNFLTTSTDQEAHIRDLLRLTTAGRVLTLSFLGLISVVLLLMLMELVRRRALLRSEEVFIERLFGAHDFSVLLPFATESAVLLLSSLMLSIVFVLGFLWLLPHLSSALSAGGVLGSLRNHTEPLLLFLLPVSFLGQILLAPVLALIGAWFGMRPQLHSRRLIVTGV